VCRKCCKFSTIIKNHWKSVTYTCKIYYTRILSRNNQMSQQRGRDCWVAD
jgi:hypothetical protein